MQRFRTIAAVTAACTFLLACGQDTEPPKEPPPPPDEVVTIRDLAVRPARATRGDTLEAVFVPSGASPDAFVARFADREVACTASGREARCTYEVRGDEVASGTEAEIEVAVEHDGKALGTDIVTIDLEPPAISRVALEVVDDIELTPWPFSQAGIGARLIVTIDATDAASIELATEPRELGERFASDLASPGRFHATLSEGALADGRYAVLARASDDLGNTIDVDVGAVTIDLVRPPAPRSPRLHDCRGPCPGVDTPQALTLDVEDAEADASTLLFDGSDLGSATALFVRRPSPAATSSVSPSVVLQGTFAAYRDVAGNLSDASSVPGLQGVTVDLRWHQQGDVCGVASLGRFDLRSRRPTGTAAGLEPGCSPPIDRADGFSLRLPRIDVGTVPRGTGPSGRPRRFDDLEWEPNRNRILAVTRHATWAQDAQGWRELGGTQPSCGRDGRLAHDRIRGVTVLVCENGVGFRARLLTYEHDGTAWREVPVPGPSPVEGLLGYDPGGGRVIYVGAREDTWAYDGTEWRAVASTPVDVSPGRFLSDPTRGELILMVGGGLEGSTRTWVLGAAGWNRGADLPGPVHDAAHDEARGTNVVRGRGSNRRGVALWTGDASEWHELPLRGAFVAFHDFVYDGNRQAVVSFAEDGEIQRHDNGAWFRERHGRLLPNWVDVVAYDHLRDRLVLIEAASNADVESPALHWEWDGTTWTATTGPTLPLFSATGAQPGLDELVFDPSTRRLVGLADWGGFRQVSRTYVHDSTQGWRELPSHGPVTEARLTYDSTHQRVLAYDAYRSLWALNGDQWTQVPTSTSGFTRSSRSDYVFYDDPERAQVVLAGYGHPSGAALRGNRWVPVARPGLPSLSPGINGLSVQPDPANGRLVAGPRFAEFRNGAWSEAPPAPGPRPGTVTARSAFDPAGGRLLVAATQDREVSTFGGIWSYTERWQEPAGHYHGPTECDSVEAVGSTGGFWCIELGRTWIWDGTSWTRTATTSTWNEPGALTFDPGRSAMHFHSTRQSYTFESGEWTPRSTSPPGVFAFPWASFQAVHDPATGAALAVAARETWLLDGATWRWITTSTAIPGTPARLLSDTANGRARLYLTPPPSRPAAFEWTGAGWAATAAPGSVPSYGFFDPTRDRWTVRSGGWLQELTGTQYITFEEDRSFARHGTVAAFDETRGELVVLPRDRPQEILAAPDRRTSRAGVHLTFDVEPRPGFAAQAVHLELVGGGRGHSIEDGTPIDGFEVWLWRWDQHAYERVGELEHGLDTSELGTVTVVGDVDRYLEPDRALHVFVRTRGPFGRGPVTPRLDIDLLRVLVDLRPVP